TAASRLPCPGEDVPCRVLEGLMDIEEGVLHDVQVRSRGAVRATGPGPGGWPGRRGTAPPRAYPVVRVAEESRSSWAFRDRNRRNVLRLISRTVLAPSPWTLARAGQRPHHGNLDLHHPRGRPVAKKRASSRFVLRRRSGGGRQAPEERVHVSPEALPVLALSL